VHRLLNWRLVMPQLRAAALEEVAALPAPARAAAHVTEGPAWDEARREGCGSPAEWALLRGMRSAGMPEPEKQFQVAEENGRVITLADFAYPASRVLVYVDGLAFHSSTRMRIHDALQSNRLQALGYRVLRFPAPLVFRDVAVCVEQVRAVCGVV
jgi:very-short-patch-repair endonuclease